MANVGRRLGANIFTLMQNSGISREDFARQMNYTYRDVCRVIEGKLMLTPHELVKVAEVLGTTKKELLSCEVSDFVPELQYMKGFSNAENLDLLLDLLDEYVELKEAM
ncbi:MAG: helix-turn-helix transcriptional regulator [Lachnospiraceae bacterium]|nr:helix-turn-helix transcriptional regulator [Lachnospiraceae bacterium]